MYLIIDGEKILNRETLHDLLFSALELPAWYGRNLDALHDCLSSYQETVAVIFLHEPELEENLGAYAFAFKRALRACAEENPRITLYAAKPQEP